MDVSYIFLKFYFFAESPKSYQSFVSRTYIQDLLQAFAESWISDFMNMQPVGPHFILKVIYLILQWFYKKYSYRVRAGLL